MDGCKEASGIHIVENNYDIRSYLKQELSTKYNVIESENGLAGFEKAVENVPDIIISDIMMPVMNGFELCKKLKTDERTSHIPIILLIAQQSDENRPIRPFMNLLIPFDLTKLRNYY